VNVIGAMGELLVNIGLSLILVRDFGIAGVAFSTAIAHWLYTIIMIVFCKYSLGVQPKSFYPDPLGWSFYALIGLSGILAWSSLGFSGVLVLVFYIPIGLLTIFSARKLM